MGYEDEKMPFWFWIRVMIIKIFLHSKIIALKIRWKHTSINDEKDFPSRKLKKSNTTILIFKRFNYTFTKKLTSWQSTTIINFFLHLPKNIILFSSRILKKAFYLPVTSFCDGKGQILLNRLVAKEVRPLTERCAHQS